MRALVYDEYTTDDDYAKILKIKDLPEPKPKQWQKICERTLRLGIRNAKFPSRCRKHR